MTVATYCDECGRGQWACACGLTYREKLLSIVVDTSWMPAKSKKNYYDAESLNDLFGEDASERMKEETLGIGACSQEEWNKYTDLQDDIAHFYTEGTERDDT